MAQETRSTEECLCSVWRQDRRDIVGPLSVYSEAIEAGEIFATPIALDDEGNYAEVHLEVLDLLRHGECLDFVIGVCVIREVGYAHEER